MSQSVSSSNGLSQALNSLSSENPKTNLLTDKNWFLICDYIEEYKDVRALIIAIKGIAKTLIETPPNKFCFSLLDRYVIQRNDISFLESRIEEIIKDKDGGQKVESLLYFCLDDYRNSNQLSDYLNLILQNDISSIFFDLYRGNNLTFFKIWQAFNSVVIKQNSLKYPLEGDYNHSHFLINGKAGDFMIPSNGLEDTFVNAATLGLENLVGTILEDPTLRVSELSLGLALIRAASMCQYSIDFGVVDQNEKNFCVRHQQFEHFFSTPKRSSIIRAILSYKIPVSSKDFNLAFKNMILLPENEMASSEIISLMNLMTTDKRFALPPKEIQDTCEKLLLLDRNRFTALIQTLSEENLLAWQNRRNLEDICLRTIAAQDPNAKQYQAAYDLLQTLWLEYINWSTTDELKELFADSLLHNYPLALDILKNEKFEILKAPDLALMLKDAVESFPQEDDNLEMVINFLAMKPQFAEIASKDLNAIFIKAVEKKALFFVRALIGCNRFCEVSFAGIDYAMSVKSIVKLMVLQQSFQKRLNNYAPELFRGTYGDGLALLAYENVYQKRNVALSIEDRNTILKEALQNATMRGDSELIQVVLSNEEIQLTDRDWQIVSQNLLSQLIRKPLNDLEKTTYIELMMAGLFLPQRHLFPDSWKNGNCTETKKASEIFSQELSYFFDHYLLDEMKQAILAPNPRLFERIFNHQRTKELGFNWKDLGNSLLFCIQTKGQDHKEDIHDLAGMIFLVYKTQPSCSFMESSMKKAIFYAASRGDSQLMRLILKSVELHFDSTDEWKRLFQSYFDFYIANQPIADPITQIKRWLNGEFFDQLNLSPEEWKDVNKKDTADIFSELSKVIFQEHIVETMINAIMEPNNLLFAAVFEHSKTQKMPIDWKELGQAFVYSISKDKLMHKTELEAIGKLIYNNDRAKKEISSSDMDEFIDKMQNLGEENCAFIYQILLLSPLEISPKTIGRKLSDAVDANQFQVVPVLLQRKSDISSDYLNKAYELSRKKLNLSRDNSSMNNSTVNPRQISASVSEVKSPKLHRQNSASVTLRQKSEKNLRNYQLAKIDEEKTEEKKDKNCIVQ